MLHRWTIRFEQGRYTVDAPTAEDAMTMYRVNVQESMRVHAIIGQLCRERFGRYSVEPVSLSLEGPHRSSPMPDRGLWVDGSEKTVEVDGIWS